MPRKSDRKPTVASPIHSRQQQLARQEEALKAKLSQTRKFLDKVPALKDEVQKKQQRELVDRFNRPARLEGPVDFRLDFVAQKGAKPPPRLRHERRSKAPLLTLALLILFLAVAYFTWKSF
jgi:hypothetical protein